ncbi:MAG: MFS transporter, partial [Pseudomonadota bacterium]
LIGQLLTVTLHAFDELAVVTALPVIVADLGGQSLYGAVFFAYMLASMVSMVWAGVQTDQHGPLKPFIWGLCIFAIGLIVGALAPTMSIVVLGRALQGLGGGAMSAVVYASIIRAYTVEERPRIMALLSAAWVLPALLAPAVAGAVAEFVHWRLVFAGLLPFVALTAILAVPGMSKLGGGEPQSDFYRKNIDACLLAAGAGLFLTGLSLPPDWLSGLLCISGISLAYSPFIRIMPDGILRARSGLAAAVLLKLLLVGSFFGAEAFLPLVLTSLHGFTAYAAGIALTAAALSWSSFAFVQARLAKRLAMRDMIYLGTALLLIGVLILFGLLISGIPGWIVYVAWAVAGAGMGFAYNTVSTGAMFHTKPGREGATSTAIGIAEAIGISLATGLGGAVLNAGERNDWHLSEGLIFIWGGVVMGLVILLSLAHRIQTVTRLEEQ